MEDIRDDERIRIADEQVAERVSNDRTDKIETTIYTESAKEKIIYRDKLDSKSWLDFLSPSAIFFTMVLMLTFLPFRLHDKIIGNTYYMVCPKCGNEVNKKQKKCNNCSTPIP